MAPRMAMDMRIGWGRLLAYIRSTEDSGEIAVNFISPLLIGDSVKIKVNR